MTPNRDIDILLVENDSSDAELTIHTLRKNNLANSIQIVEDGEEALDFLFCRRDYEDRSILDRPKVILLDLKLPKIEGLEVLRALKNDVATRAIPVVILTSSREPKDLVEGYRLGASAYVQKPVDFDQFRQTIREIGLFWILLNQPPPIEVFEVEYLPRDIPR
jgi:two-component system, response regulator